MIKSLSKPVTMEWLVFLGAGVAIVAFGAGLTYLALKLLV